MDPTKTKHAEIIKLLRLNDRRSWILMVPNSIGEVATVCGFAKSFVERHGHGITLVIRDTHNYIPAMYPGRFNTVINASLDLMRELSSFGLIPPNHFDVDFPFNTWPAQYGDGRLAQLTEHYSHGHGRGGLTFLDLYRHILRLDWDAPIERGRIPDDLRTKAIGLATQHGIIQDRSVILFPGNNTSAPAPLPFWQAVAQLYTGRGFRVFTNAAGADFLPGTMPIPGTQRLELTGDLALAVSELAGNMVIGSNGLVTLALLAGIKCNIHSVLTDQICNDRTEGFKPSVPIYSSCQLHFPEACHGQDNFAEWIVSTADTAAMLHSVASNIVDNRHSDRRVSLDRLTQHMRYDRAKWAAKLIC